MWPFFIRATAYLCIGITAEILFTGLKALFQKNDRNMPGHTTLWMVPIYFFGLPLGFEWLAGEIAGLNIFLRAVIYATLILAIEYVAATLILWLTKKNPWEYTQGWHIKGRIRIDRFPVWAFFGIVLEYVRAFLHYHII